MRAVETFGVAFRRQGADFTRHAAFAAVVLGALVWFWGPLATVVNLSFMREDYEHYSHIVAIPFMSLFLIYRDRAAIHAEVDGAPRLGALIIVGALMASWLPRVVSMHQESMWSLEMLLLVVTALGGFIACYGLRAFRTALFPLLFLLLMVPLPPSWVHVVIAWLQYWSAETSAVIFEAIGVPFYRDGFLFALPGLNIRIAEECSGIRSTLALTIMGLLSGQLFLRKAWSRTALAAIVIPLGIFKNAVRIVVLSMLAIHVDPSFITGSVTHRFSGIPVFAMAFAILGGVIWVLQLVEARQAARATGVSG